MTKSHPKRIKTVAILGGQKVLKIPYASERLLRSDYSYNPRESFVTPSESASKAEGF